MIKELIVLADELDKCNEKEAADFIDKLVKSAIKEQATDEWDDIPTRVDPIAQGLEPLPSLRELQEERRRKMESKQNKPEKRTPTLVHPNKKEQKIESLVSLYAGQIIDMVSEYPGAEYKAEVRVKQLLNKLLSEAVRA